MRDTLVCIHVHVYIHVHDIVHVQLSMQLVHVLHNSMYNVCMYMYVPTYNICSI